MWLEEVELRLNHHHDHLLELRRNSVVGSGTFSNGTAAKGGTYTVGWEQSFGFTDNFDPTGEYLGNAWGLYSNLMLRALVGYKHLPGAAGNEHDRRPRNDGAERRPTTA